MAFLGGPQMLILVLCLLSYAFLAGWLAFFTVPFLPKRTTEESPEAEISIIIPARNEENNLPRLLTSLKQQKLQPKEVIIVDDDSEDDTIRIAEQFGAKVVRKNEYEAAVGKSAACFRGAKAASGEWLLFLDADTYLNDPEGLQRFALAYHAQDCSGILSVQPYHTVQRLYESLSIVFNIMVLAGMNVFTVFKNQFTAAGAFGPCLLCSREQYFLIGGHEESETTLMEDFVLGKKFQQQGLALKLYAGKEVVHFRMYSEGIQQLIEGWSKNFATASQSTHPVVLLLIVSWISGGIGTGIFLIVSLITASNSWIVGAVMMYFIYLAQFFVFAKRVGHFNRLAILSYPILFLFFIVLFSWSIIQTHLLRTVTWKGRKIKIE